MTRIFKIRPSTVHETFGDETIVVNLDSGTYYSALNTANDVWRMISAGLSETAIVQSMAKRYSGDETEIGRSVSDFLDSLLAEAVVEFEDAATPPAADTDALPAAGERVPFTAPALQKYTDMEDMLLLDPIHEVDEQGWPTMRKQTE